MVKLTYLSSVEATARSSAVNPWVPLGPRVLVGSLACREIGLEWLPHVLVWCRVVLVHRLGTFSSFVTGRVRMGSFPPREAVRPRGACFLPFSLLSEEELVSSKLS